MDGHSSGGSSRVPHRRPRSKPSRRAVVLGLGAAAVAGLSGCGLRLDLPQPPPPVPTRRPAVDERLLIAVIGETRALLAALPAEVEGAAGRTVEQMRQILGAQADTLTGRLTNEGVPLSLIERAPGTGAPSSAASRTPGTAPDIAGLLIASLPDAVWKPLTSATAATRELCSAAYSVRLAGAVLLGGTVAVAPTSATQAALADRSGALVYAFEVVAAQSAGTQRKRALETLATLREVEREVGTSAGAGWSLPFEVTTPAAAARLATESLRRAVAALPDLTVTAKDPAALSASVRWSARVQAAAVPWGLALAELPGASRP